MKHRTHRFSTSAVQGMLIGFLLLVSSGLSASAFPYSVSGGFLSPYGDVVQAPNGERTFVRVNRDLALSAVATGQLAIPLPSGDVMLAQHQRDFTNERGDWTFVGRVDTAVGALSAVLTFGTDGVFGVIPSASGKLLQLQSGSGGKAWIEPIDDLIPPSKTQDALLQEASHDHPKCYVIPEQKKSATDRQPLTDAEAKLIAQSGTVTIDVLGIYTSGVVEDRGSAAAAETYFHSLVELANQAFVDSGIDVRYRLVGLRLVPEWPGRFNSSVLSDLAANRIPGIDVGVERESVQADLVAVLRRYQQNDPSCGIAFLNGSGLRAETVVDGNPFSVTACGGYVLAHEFGHNLGSMHDVETTFGTGIGAGGFGAYRFSFGYRQPGRFSTIMAYGTSGAVLIGRYSDPSASTCMGGTCGIEHLADNAQSLRLMAPRIAGFRTGLGGISVGAATVSVSEGNTGSAAAWIWLLSSQPAPAGGITIDWETADGTAVAGWDYQPVRGRAVLPAGSNQVAISIPIIGDTQIESDETILIRFASAMNARIREREVSVFIKNDDPAGRVSGTVRFPSGMTPPNQPFWLSVSGHDADGLSVNLPSILVSPPNFNYQFTAPLGAVLNIVAHAPEPFPTSELSNVTVRTETLADLHVAIPRTVSGRLVFPSGNAPASGQFVEVVSVAPGSSRAVFHSVRAEPPEFRFSRAVADGSRVQLRSGVPGSPSTARAQHLTLARVSTNTSVDITMGLLPTVGFSRKPLGRAEGGSVCYMFQLSAPTNQSVTVPVELVAGSGSVPGDARLRSADDSELSFSPNSVFDWACVSFLADGETEPTETVTLRLGQPVNAVLESGGTEGELSIVDVPPVEQNQRIRISLGDVQLVEGHAGHIEALVPLSFSRPIPSGGLRLRLSTVDGTAMAGQDYQASSLLWNLPPNLSSVVFPVRLFGDRLDEADETLLVRVSEVSSAVPTEVTEGESVITIRNDDANPRLRILDASIEEGDTGTTSAMLQMSLSHPANVPVSVNWATSDGTASAGSDYTASSGVALIPVGQSSARINVELRGDFDVEPSETFNVTLSNASGALVDDGIAFFTIFTDDHPDLPGLRPRHDQAHGIENTNGIVVPAMANDVFTATRSPRIELVDLPNVGHASIDSRGTSDPTDDTVLFVPPRNWSGTTSLTYRLCEATRCSSSISPARITIHVSPVSLSSLDLAVSTNRGHRDVVLFGLRSLPGVRFVASSLSAPQTEDIALGLDNTPETPWDQARVGAAHVLGTLSGTSGAVMHWRVLSKATGLSGDVDLYVGEDTNNDGQPSENELRCVSAMSVAGERCELTAIVGIAATGRYWVMLHNRSGSVQHGRLHRYEVPLLPSDGSLVTTAPGILAVGESFPLRVNWDDPSMLRGESRLGYIQMQLGGVTQAVFPVRLSRNDNESSPLALVSGAELTLRVPVNGSHEQLFIDVPAGASNLYVTTESATNVDIFLARVPAPVSGGGVPVVGLAPHRSQAQASGTTPSGNERVSVANPAMGRWFITPVNATAIPATLVLRATVSGSAVPVLRPGGYYNTGRSGHGLFLHPAGSYWAGIWYTYLQDRTPTWYYLQGSAPGANGVWRADVYRGTWVGGGGFLTVVGEAKVTPSSPDAFTFTYTLDGQVGSEAFSVFGRGCPVIDGSPVDISQHYFDPTRSGAGYSVQVMTSPGPYEFHAMFVYDARGVPRFLVAENPPINNATGTLTVEQLFGFCPLCERTGPPVRNRVGSYVRTLTGGRISRVAVDVAFTGGVPGAWRVTDNLIMLDPLNRVMGCQ